ncbi:MAG: hypothetical protein IJG87_06410 [Ruminococcus sp.]|nr:hypothetical protein [Ruminococcus sp.]
MNAKEDMISRYAFESAMVSFEKTIKRLWIIILLLIILLAGTNGAWIWYESQWEVVETTEIEQEVDTGIGNAFVSGTGDVIYGQSEAENQNDQDKAP